jgi:hypothetical protein
MTTSHVPALFALLIALLTLGPPSAGQSLTGNTDQSYEDRNQVEPQPLKLPAVEGIAIDPAAAPVSQAQVLLFTSQKHRLVAKTHTDADGRFELRNVRSGHYRLVVKSEGFCPANVPINLRSGKADKKLVLHMRMGEIDVCSYGDLE